jgi:hypothetical protein
MRVSNFSKLNAYFSTINTNLRFFGYLERPTWYVCTWICGTWIGLSGTCTGLPGPWKGLPGTFAGLPSTWRGLSGTYAGLPSTWRGIILGTCTGIRSVLG